MHYLMKALVTGHHVPHIPLRTVNNQGLEDIGCGVKRVSAPGSTGKCDCLV